METDSWFICWCSSCGGGGVLGALQLVAKLLHQGFASGLLPVLVEDDMHVRQQHLRDASNSGPYAAASLCLKPNTRR